MIAFSHLKRLFIVLLIGLAIVESFYRLHKLKYRLWRNPPRLLSEKKRGLFYRLVETFVFNYKTPNARAKGRGRTKLGEKHQSVTPRPLERRVGLPLRERKPGLHCFCSFSLPAY